MPHSDSHSNVKLFIAFIYNLLQVIQFLFGILQLIWQKFSGISGTPLCVKRRMFFLMVYGVVTEEPYTILKITQESTTQDVLTLCLQKAGINVAQLNDYILVEEVARGWEKKDHNLPATQRILDLHERPLQVK